MTLQLDARQRAMLKEMGVVVWLPGTSFAVQAPARAGESAVDNGAAAPVPQRPPLRPAKEIAPASPRPAPVPATAAASGPVAADWPGLLVRVGGCNDCALHTGRTQPVLPAQAPAQADWLVVLDPPGAEEERVRTALAGDAAVLLDNMLKAAGVARTGSGAQGAYVTTVVKCRPPHATTPAAAELQQCLQHLRSEIALVRPRLVLLMGRFAQQLVQPAGAAPAPLEHLRGTVHRLEGLPAVVTYHPSILLRASAHKGKAWADLCLAMDTLDALG